MPTLLTMWDTLEKIKDLILDTKLSPLGDVASMIACVLVAVSVLGVSKNYILGHVTDFWDLLKPLVILALVCNFNSLVLGPVDGLINIFSRDVMKETNLTTKQYMDQWADNLSLVAANALIDEAQSIDADLETDLEDAGIFESFFLKIWSTIRKCLMGILNVGTLGLSGGVGALLFLLVKLLLMIQQILSVVYQIINALIGPFVLAMTILPGFASGFRSWVARYIQIAMWIPVGYLILYINLQIGTAFVTLGNTNETDLSTQWLMVGLQLVAMISIAAVPKICAWIIESTGANDAHGGLSGAARAVVKKAIHM